MRKTAEIIDLIMNKKKLKSVTSVAQILGMTQQALSYHKNNNTKPFEQLIKLCEDEDLSFDWLVLGRADYKKELRKLENQVEEDIKLIKEMDEKIKKATQDMEFFKIIISKIPPGEYK